MIIEVTHPAHKYVPFRELSVGQLFTTYSYSYSSNASMCVKIALHQQDVAPQFFALALSSNCINEIDNDCICYLWEQNKALEASPVLSRPEE